MFLALVMILAGLVALIGGAELLVRGAVWVALRLGISPMTVGLTLVAFGTSAPELMVSLEAAMRGKPAIAVGNVLGSNVANVLLIVGIAAVIQRIRIGVDRMESWVMLLATALAGIPYLTGSMIGRPLGGVMVAMLVAFCWFLLLRERNRPAAHRPVPTTPLGTMGWTGNVMLFLVGLAALKFGADWLIEGSSTVAQRFGMPDALIGMTIVALGTSLPELATSVIAARRHQPEIAVGNVIGSNIFNVGSVLGITALVHPIAIDPAETGALMIATAVSALVLVLVLHACRGVSRPMGGIFLLSWVGYIAWESWRTLG